MNKNLHSIQKQIYNIEGNILLIEEQISEYVLSTEVPMQLKREIEIREKKLAELREEERLLLKQERDDLFRLLDRYPQYKDLIDRVWIKAYNSFRPEDSTYPNPVDLKGALEAFYQLPTRENEFRLVLRFVGLLISLPDRNLPGTIKNKLWSWLKPRINEGSAKAFLEEINQDIITIKARQQNERSPCLLVWIEKGENLPGYFIRSMRLVKDREIYDPKLAGGEDILISPDHRFEEEGDEDKVLSIAEIKQILQKRLTAIGHQGVNLAELTIHTFLSFYDLSWNLDRWPAYEGPDPECLGYRCKGVVMRVVERFTINRYAGERGSWKAKWDDLMKLVNKRASQHIYPGDGIIGKELVINLRDPSWVGLQLTKAPPPFTSEEPHPFDAFVRSGVPIAIWPRQDLEPEDCQAELNQLLNCSLAELLERLRQRRAAIDCEDLEEGSHICHHISLIWEDPKLVPPELYNLSLGRKTRKKTRMQMPGSS